MSCSIKKNLYDFQNSKVKRDGLYRTKQKTTAGGCTEASKIADRNKDDGKNGVRGKAIRKVA